MQSGQTVWVGMRSRPWKCSSLQLRPAIRSEILGAELQSMSDYKEILTHGGSRAMAVAVNVEREGDPPDAAWHEPVRPDRSGVGSVTSSRPEASASEEISLPEPAGTAATEAAQFGPAHPSRGSAPSGSNSTRVGSVSRQASEADDSCSAGADLRLGSIQEEVEETTSGTIPEDLSSAGGNPNLQGSLPKRSCMENTSEPSDPLISSSSASSSSAVPPSRSSAVLTPSADLPLVTGRVEMQVSEREEKSRAEEKSYRNFVKHFDKGEEQN